MKKPQSARAIRRRESIARLNDKRHCPKHGDKMSTTALFWRCGCPTR